MKVRRLKIDFSQVKPHWAPNIEFAQHENAGGLTPAHVEPYLIKVMYLAKAELPASYSSLHADIATFIKQESEHYKQHMAFNKALYSAGYERLADFDRELSADYERFLAQRSLKFNCAYCEGFESLGPPNALAYFEFYADLLEGADRNAVDLWKWHMAEEFEHRHVAYQVFHALYGRKSFIDAYFYRLYGFFCTMRHLGGWTARVNAYLIGKDRETMSAEELKLSRKRERVVKRRLLLKFLPQLLRVLSPFYDPSKLRPPKGMSEFMGRVEADYPVKVAMRSIA
jgi:predicted metal-dependent hydrolase